jgi:hypothetical protein
LASLSTDLRSCTDMYVLLYRLCLCPHDVGLSACAYVCICVCAYVHTCMSLSLYMLRTAAAAPRRTRALVSLPHVPLASRVTCVGLCAAAGGRRGAVGGVVSMVVRGEHFICSPTEINALILARFIHSSQPPRWPGGSRAADECAVLASMECCTGSGRSTHGRLCAVPSCVPTGVPS